MRVFALLLCVAFAHCAASSPVEQEKAAPTLVRWVRSAHSTYAEWSRNTLDWAVTSRRSAAAHLLLAAGAKPTAHTMWVSIQSGDTELCLRLLDAGADPNIVNADGASALMVCTNSGDLTLVDALLKHHANVDSADSNGHRALHCAIAARNVEIIERLLAAKARIGGKGDAFPAAVETRDWQLIQALLEHSPLRTWDTAGRSALKIALLAKDVPGMRLVMSKHSGPVTPEGFKVPLLAYAVVANDLDLTRILLDAGADPNTPIAAPAEPKFLEYVPQKFLRQYLSEEPGMNVLIVAAGIGNEAMVRLLLEHGADRNRATKSKYKLVPIYFAGWGGHAECIQALIENAPTPDQMRVEISLTAQQATLYKNGAAIFHTEISSGQPETPTPTGRFVITDKKTLHISNIYHAQMPYFMRLSCKDFGMHEGELPGYPASHGCIRLPGDSARKLFREVPIGTLVMIQ